MKDFLQNNRLSLLLTFSLIGLGLALRTRLPTELPTHFDLHGVPDGYASRDLAIVLLPGLALLLLLILPGLVKISPEQFRMPHSSSVISRVNLAVTLLLNGIQLGILLSALEPGRFRIQTFIVLSLSACLIGIGNFISKIEPNLFIGVRTPWTIASERNWFATHRFAARWFVLMGIFLAVLGTLLSTPVPAFLLLIPGALVPVAYSYRYYVRHERT